MDRNTSLNNPLIKAPPSLSARRAWIEIKRAQKSQAAKQSLSARRAWIEIAVSISRLLMYSVALRKESVDRNRKPLPYPPFELMSLSARRAWIEMTADPRIVAACEMSLSARRAWIEITSAVAFLTAPVSLSARRAWIEILMVVLLCHHISVALRKESVDRNNVDSHGTAPFVVALRKESVDRNSFGGSM